MTWEQLANTFFSFKFQGICYFYQLWNVFPNCYYLVCENNGPVSVPAAAGQTLLIGNFEVQALQTAKYQLSGTFPYGSSLQQH